jgi:hypothetical protein
MNYRSHSSVHASQRYVRSGAAYLRTIDGPKVMQILAVYAFALVAAVACGQGFQPKGIAQDAAPAATTIGEPATDFKPSIADVVRSNSGTSQTIKLTLIDGSSGASLELAHNNANWANAVQSVGDHQYHGGSYCVDAECKEVAILLARVKGYEAKQSAVLISAPVVGAAQAVAFIHGTRYDEPEEALSALRRAKR